MDENKNEFVREKIKDKPVNKKRMVGKFLIALACGVIAAVVFCLIVVLALPTVLKKRGIDLSLLKDSGNATTEQTTETEDSETDTPETELNTEEADTEPVQVIANPITAEDYQAVMKEVYAIGNTTRQSTVTVTSVTESTDWFNHDVESKGTGLGVIIGSTDSEVQILTDYELIAKAKSIHVTLQDGTSVEAVLKSKDGGTGLAVVSIARQSLSTVEASLIQEIVMANSAGTTVGDMVLVIQSSGMYSGFVTSTTGEKDTYDHNYAILSTDITAASDEPGILVNLEGQLVGMILPKFQYGEEVSAISISQMKTVIDILCRGESVPYIGLSISTVTDSIASEYNLPYGVYVSEVAMDSPAMLAGIQAGDVVTEINGNESKTAGSYSSRLLSCKVGDTIEVTVMRLGADGYSEITYEVTVGQQ